MRTHRHSFRHAPLCAALVLAAFGIAAVRAQTVDIDADCVPQLTRQQQRLHQKAAEGADALRQFIFIRRAILQVDTYETATWAESLDEARAACLQKRSAIVSTRAPS